MIDEFNHLGIKDSLKSCDDHLLITKESDGKRANSLDCIPDLYDKLLLNEKSMNFRRVSAKSLALSDGIIFSMQDLEIQEVLGEGFFGRVRIKNSNEIMGMKELKETRREHEKRFCNETLDLTPEIKEKIAYDISCGMAYLHSKMIAHRDLTSLNCLLRDRVAYDVVVADFGLSRVVNKVSVQHNTNQDVGAPCWTAPEMLNGKHYDLSVDVFSYGIVLCEVTRFLYQLLARNFGLNEDKFVELVKNIKNPSYLVNLAIIACDVNPNRRPKFRCVMNFIRSKMGEIRLDGKDV
ncbi:LIM domain kinase 2 [Thelohanellus kitauei]|uniref:LIM domain kinase 2 n=1 Tax=Thelohanellus kitauei TaxID=669202 RepID=A0A0C2J481_THEKT|nr:LIM domain kinase 2 [Thelohanellus kitauei]